MNDAVRPSSEEFRAGAIEHFGFLVRDYGFEVKPLSDWAYFAEIVSGIAVVVTLVFLIVGIQENTDVTRFSVYADLIDELNENDRIKLANPQVGAAWEAYANERTGELSSEDLSRVRLQAVLVFRSYEKAFFARKYEVIGEAEWRRFQRLTCLHDARVRSAGVSVEPILTSEFMEYIKSECRT